MATKKKMETKVSKSQNNEAEEQPVEAEVVLPHKEIMPVNSQIVRPMISAVEAKKAWLEYQELKKSFLDPNLDYQVINTFIKGQGTVRKPFIKKSGWRKLATAFNISVEVVKEERKEIDVPGSDLKYFVVEITAKAIAMNGRYMMATGSCASNERTFSKLEHDIRATAETRAKNRAISDLIGGGEVSAEELEQQLQAKQNTCSINHDDLPDKVVGPGSKNTGRHYHKCTKCNYWKWIDSAPTESAGETEPQEATA